MIVRVYCQQYDIYRGPYSNQVTYDESQGYVMCKFRIRHVLYTQAARKVDETNADGMRTDGAIKMIVLWVMTQIVMMVQMYVKMVVEWVITTNTYMMVR